MQGKAHIAAGVAASLAILQPASLGGCCAAVLGGCVGSAIPDIDQPPTNYVRDAMHHKVIVSTIVSVVIAADYLTHAGLCDYLVDHAGPQMVFAALAFVALCVFGHLSKHRTLTHSLLCGALMSQALWYVCPMLAAPFGIGFASHLVLDLLNYQKVQLLWPLKLGAFSLGLCHAKGTVDTAITVCGTIATVALLVWRLWVGLGA